MSFVLGEGFVDIEVKADKANKQLDSFKANLKSVQDGMNKVNSFAKRVLFATTAVAGLSLAAAQQQEQATAKLETVLKSTGNAAQRTSEQLHKQAEELENLTGIGDQSIVTMQAILASFTEIQGIRFDRAVEGGIALSELFDTDLKSAAIQLGKALNDPAKGLSAMADSGVSFTESQKEMIKAMQAAGDMAGAQTMILDILGTQGISLMDANTRVLTVSLRRLANRFTNLAEKIGNALIPVIVALDKALTPVINAVAKWVEKNPEFTAGVITLTGAIAALTFGITALGSAAIALSLSPIALVIAKFALLTGLVVGLTAAVATLAIGFTRASQTGDSFTDSLKDTLGLLTFAFKNITVLMDSIPMLMDAALMQLTKLIGGLLQKLGAVEEFFKGKGKSSIKKFGDELVQGAEIAIDEIADKLGQKIGEKTEKERRKEDKARVPDLTLPQFEMPTIPKIDMPDLEQNQQQQAQQTRNVFAGLQESFIAFSTTAKDEQVLDENKKQTTLQESIDESLKSIDGSIAHLSGTFAK